VVHPIGVITATGASITLVASQRPPIPTSMTAMSTGASRMRWLWAYRATRSSGGPGLATRGVVD
jgi:hypothetical protein